MDTCCIGIGFDNTVNNTIMPEMLNRLMDALRKGATFQKAIDHANARNKLDHSPGKYVIYIGTHPCCKKKNLSNNSTMEDAVK
jgi:hypothetical protein